MRSWIVGILFTVGFSFSSSVEAAGPLGFAVPEGFEVSLYADDDLATDIYSMTIDDRGRIVVAGKGYVKVLQDDNGDGKADRATTFSEAPKSGAHGMYFDGPDLIADGDNGVRRYRDTDGDGKVDSISPVWLPMSKDTEHGANGIVQGPDGWFYLIAGNDVGISKVHVRTSGSPVKNPHQGALIRFTADGKQSEVLADGLRNPYDLSFNDYGEVFTVDADGERIYHLPYYSPTRLFDLAQGMHHGWVLPGWQRCWGRPQHWPDSVQRLVEIGRGSPTGVMCYRHHAFPQRYRDGVFAVCWSFGRIYFFPLNRQGSTYGSKLETFLQTTGDVGFAPTDLAVGPQGDLFVSIGGRGTRGSVFRVHYKGPIAPVEKSTDSLRQVLAADEPLSSWSRAQWVPLAKKLGRGPFAAAALDTQRPLLERIRAIEVLTELFGGIDIASAKALLQTGGDPALTTLASRAIWSLSRSNPDVAARKILIKATSERSPQVARAAWEAVMTLPELDVAPDFKVGLEHPDRRVRAAALLVAQGVGRPQFQAARKNWKPPSFALRIAELWVDEMGADPAQVELCLEVILQSGDDQLRLEAVRLLQKALGDVWLHEGPESVFIGYKAETPQNLSPEVRMKMARSVASVFPTRRVWLDYELGRLLAMLGEDVPGALPRVAAQWPTGSVESDIHYLFVLARLPGSRTPDVSKRTARALHGIFTQLAARGAKPSDQVPTILEELFERLLIKDPGLGDALAADPEFGISGEELFAIHLPEKSRQQVTRRFLTTIGKLEDEDADLAWNPELVKLVSLLPEAEGLAILRDEFKNPRITDRITLILAQKAQPVDRLRFLSALGSMQAPVVAAAANALLKIDEPTLKAKTIAPEARHVVQGVRALRRFGGKNDQDVRGALQKLLQAWAGEIPSGSDAGQPAVAADAWKTWFSQRYPEESKELMGFSGANAAAWKKRIESVDWTKGDVKQGFAVFQKRNCFRCHAEAKRVGPDLRGVAQRFSVADLFSHIVEPSKDISPTYQSKLYTTNSGKTYSGMIVYQSQEVTLLQTTPDVTIRLQQSDVASVQPSPISFMPAGLLDDASDRDLVDLLAYLKTLKK